jgi:Tripartite tricarboxylate transporter TctB family
MDRTARNDAIAGLMVLAVVAVFGPATSKIFIDPLDPGFSAQDFPIGVRTLMTPLSLALCARAAVRLARGGWQLYEAGEAGPLLRYLVPIIALGFLYVWLLEIFQYLLPTFLALSASLAIFGNRGLIRLVVVPVIVAAIFYIIFYGIFGLNEPAGTILSYNNDWYFRPFREFLGF